MSTITLTTPDNFELAVVFNEQKGSNKAIVFAHGMTVDMDDEEAFVEAEKKLFQAGFTTLRFDFRAHGKSTGRSISDFTISGELIDLHTVITFLKEKNINWIGLAGASFGGGIAALYAGQNSKNINALLLANPTLDYTKCFLKPTTDWAKKHFQDFDTKLSTDGFLTVGSRKFKLGPLLFSEMKQYVPYVDLAAYQGPLEIIHGDADDKISYKDVQDTYEAIDNPLKHFSLLKGANHGFHEEPYLSRVASLVVDFFAKQK